MTGQSLAGHTSSVADVQRRTLGLLFTSQVLAGIGVSIGMSVGALLAADLVSVGVSGLAQSAAVMGGALLAIPATRLVRRHGRGPSLAAAYLTAAMGGAFVVLAAMTHSIPLLFAGYFLFGGGTTASLQARYAAVDLAPPTRYGRHLSLVVWATTIGGVVGPNLAALAGVSLGAFGIPPLAAPFAFSSALFLLSSVLLFVWLRPDPLRLAQSMGAGGAGAAASVPYAGLRAAARAVLAQPDARLGVAATALGHLMMVAVMAMTPVHIRSAGHGPPETLRLVGLVLSLHVAGMYAFAPLMGWLSDRIGRRPVIVAGALLLLGACAVAGTAGHDTRWLAAGLMLLGLGWSATMVAGSALLSQAMAPDLRPSAQGLSDVLMGLAGATAGALSGVVVQAFGYPMLTALVALTAVPLLALAVLPGARRVTEAGA